MAFVCPRCGAESFNPNDLVNGYCAKCRWWTGDPELGRIEPPSPIPTIRTKLAAEVREREGGWWFACVLICVYVGLFVAYMVYAGPGN